MGEASETTPDLTGVIANFESVLRRERGEFEGLKAENSRLRIALQCAQATFADIGNNERVDEIEDVLNPGWRERWAS